VEALIYKIAGQQAMFPEFLIEFVRISGKRTRCLFDNKQRVLLYIFNVKSENLFTSATRFVINFVDTFAIVG